MTNVASAEKKEVSIAVAVTRAFGFMVWVIASALFIPALAYYGARFSPLADMRYDKLWQWDWSHEQIVAFSVCGALSLGYLVWSLVPAWSRERGDGKRVFDHILGVMWFGVMMCTAGYVLAHCKLGLNLWLFWPLFSAFTDGVVLSSIAVARASDSKGGVA